MVDKEKIKREQLNEAIREKTRVLVPIMKEWGLNESDFILVGEVAFWLVGVPVIGPHIEEFLETSVLPLEVYADPTKYAGPKVSPEVSQHPYKIVIPIDEVHRIYKNLGLKLDNLLIGDKKALDAPTISVDFGEGKSCRVMEPHTSLALLAERTILRYDVDFVGKDKIKEWYLKLKRIRDAAKEVGKRRLADECEDYLARSRERWGELLSGEVN